MAQTPLGLSGLVSIELVAIPFISSQVAFIDRQTELKVIIHFGEHRLDLPEEAFIEIGLKRGELMITMSQIEQPEVRTSIRVIEDVTTSEARKSHKELFEAKQDLILSGNREVSLGIITKPCHVIATFEVRRLADLYLTRVEGLWSDAIQGNKAALLKKEVMFYFVAPHVESRLVEVEETL